MSREKTLDRILEGGIVAVVRSESSEPLVNVIRALAEGGVTAAEVTFTVPDAVEVIRQVRREVGDAVVLGAGTVLDPETARAAILAGAEYIVAPTVNLDVIRLCRRYDKVVMPGAFADRSPHGLGSRRGRRQSFPGRRRRPLLSQGSPRPLATDSIDANRRR